MNINGFFVLLALLLAGIFLFFKPVEFQRPDAKEIALLDLRAFTIYEMDQNGTVRTMHGLSGLRFKERYEINKITFVDGTGVRVKTLDADKGIYRDETLVLEGNVRFHRGEGTDALMQKATYDRASEVVRGEGPFELSQGANRITGNDLVYDMKNRRIEAGAIRADYDLQQRGVQP